VGRTEGGEVWEQHVQLTGANQEIILLRRIKIILDHPTRHQEAEIYLLTNLPQHHSALLIAEGYRKRWTIETHFQALESELWSEIPTLSHPRATLFVFAISLVTFNLDRVIQSIVRVVHGTEAAQQLSGYTIANEVQQTPEPIEQILPEEYWPSIGELSCVAFAQWLR
jgi:IS4 transposase